MKTAIRVVLGIGAGIGIIWSIIGFFGATIIGDIGSSTDLILQFILTIIGLIFGIVASGKEVKKWTGIINGLFLLICGLLATIFSSYVSGPLYVLCGLLAVLANIYKKRINGHEVSAKE